MKQLENQTAGEIEELQKQLSCSQQAEHVEVKEKRRLQDCLQAASKESLQLQEDLNGRAGEILQYQSQLARLKRGRLEDQAQIEALSQSVDEVRLDAQSAVLKAASKEEELHKMKNSLNIADAEILVLKGRVQGLEKCKSELQGRMHDFVTEIDSMKETTYQLRNENLELKAKLSTCGSVEKQLQNDLKEHRKKLQQLAEEAALKESILQSKCAELAQTVARLELVEDRFEKAQQDLQDSKLQISNILVCSC